MRDILIAVLILMSGIVHSQNHVIKIKHKSYDTYFDTVLKVPVLSYYEFTSKNRKQVVERSKGFHQDKLINPKYQAKASDYGEPWDKGHLVPNADMRYNKDVEFENMSYSNVSPQWGTMNEIQWRLIEAYVRELGFVYDTLKIYTGCIYGLKYDSLSNNIVKVGISLLGVDNIAISSYYYKAILIKSGKTIKGGIGFICNNTPLISSDPAKYVTTINFIEKMSGIDFYKEYPEVTQEQFESTSVIIR